MTKSLILILVIFFGTGASCSSEDASAMKAADYDIFDASLTLNSF